MQYSTKHLEYEAEFKEWMRIFKFYDVSTINTRVNNVVRLENAYGSLIDRWRKDWFEGLFDLLSYSRTDEILNRSFSSPLEINGNLRSNLATYRAALRLYATFLSLQKSEEFGFPFGEIGKRIHDSLLLLNKSCKKKKKYNKKDVDTLIIAPLVKYLNNELSPLGYTFSTEKVVIVNDNIKQIKDRYDIYGEADDKPIVIIEVDTHRADQVAKKLLSRLSFNVESELFYVSLVYPNDHQNKEAEKKECKKYFRFASELFSIFSSPQKHFIAHWLFE